MKKIALFAVFLLFGCSPQPTSLQIDAKAGASPTSICLPGGDCIPTQNVDPGWDAPPHVTVLSPHDTFEDSPPLISPDHDAVVNANLDIRRPDSTIWASGSVLIDGAKIEITGPVTAGSSISVGGSSLKLTGPVEYTIDANISGAGNLIPVPIKATRPIPGAFWKVEQWRPGTPDAVRLGAIYHNNSASCSGSGANRAWTVSTSLPSGIYYADCRIVISGAARRIDSSFVSEGSVSVSGAQLDMECPTNDYFLLLGQTIQIAGAGLELRCGLYASGAISITGAGSTIRSQIAGGSVNVKGAGSVIG
jgi:hypothetical protein